MGSRLTAAEQLLLEYINRARLDPAGEAARYGIGLNKDLPKGTIGTESKQVLAPNKLLAKAAEGHSCWMLANDQFSHAGKGGSSSHDRMKAAGYDFSGAWHSSENISMRGSTASLNLAKQIDSHHKGLFLSEGHRENMLAGDFREVGLAQVGGKFTYGATYNTSMLTENFARSGNKVFVTGVVYDDRDNNNFYSLGEGREGARISGGGKSVESQQAGGYALGLSGDGTAKVTLARGKTKAVVEVGLGAGNVKLDLVDRKVLLTASNLDIVGGNVKDATLLGIMNRGLDGSKTANRLTGNEGDNHLAGEGGNDLLKGMQGRDKLLGGPGGDTLKGGDGNDRLEGGTGNDLLLGDRNADKLLGDSGKDKLKGGGGNDVLCGGDGNDLLQGGNGNDRLVGNAHADRLHGGHGRDALFGGDGTDVLTGGRDRDELYGGAGTDTLRGEAGADRLDGGTGNDLLEGGDGNDRMFGGAGNDRLIGGGGNDTLDGQSGDDVLKGGGGADTFVFRADFGTDRVRDFGLDDTLRLGGPEEARDFAAFKAASRQEGLDVIYDMNGDGANVIVLEGLQLDTLKPDQFDFV